MGGMGGVVVTVSVSGGLISRFGRYKPFPVIGTAVATVGMALLAQLDLHSTTAYTSLAMVVLGLGLGAVMQVLVLAVQNAVDYRNMGVATAGSLLFRQIGGSIGIAVFGAIFTNRLHGELSSLLPPGVNPPKTVSPAAIKALPPAAHEAYVHAVAAALHPVFLTASVIARLSLLLTWLL